MVIGYGLLSLEHPPIQFFVNRVGGCCVYGRKEVERYGHCDVPL